MSRFEVLVTMPSHPHVRHEGAVQRAKQVAESLGATCVPIKVEVSSGDAGIKLAYEPSPYGLYNSMLVVEQAAYIQGTHDVPVLPRPAKYIA